MAISAAAFGRLCVETPLVCNLAIELRWQPPSGGCVLKLYAYIRDNVALMCSRLRAAVC